MTGASVSETEEKVKKILEIATDPKLSAERMLIEIKRTIDPENGLDEEDHINLGIAYREMGLYQDAVDAFWEAWSLSSSTLNCYEFLISTFEQMTPKKDDMDHLAVNLAIAINKSEELSEEDQQILKKLVSRFKALKEKHGFTK